MADPIGGGGVGKATQQMMQEMMKQAQEQAQGPNKAGGAQFANKVEGVQNTQGPSEVNKVQETTKAVQTEKSLGAHQILKAAQTGQTPNTTGVQRVEGTGVMEKTGMKRLLDQVAGGQSKLDQIIKMATSGKTFNQQELLAIQAGVYKFSQEMELTSKVVEKATSGVKQTMQTQV
ncbi:MAG: hypothetical protein CMH56_12110 [Myxococcales bacterium]|nr:hypothetical protein [Myxococcales bacterium]|tara:strand:- start:505 stop:1029 length:525 start_codon:yes stop_codon:yes gene_type:complete